MPLKSNQPTALYRTAEDEFSKIIDANVGAPARRPNVSDDARLHPKPPFWSVVLKPCTYDWMTFKENYSLITPQNLLVGNLRTCYRRVSEERLNQSVSRHHELCSL